MTETEGLSHGNRSITGRLVGVGGKADLVSVPVWFAHQTVDGEAVTTRTLSDHDGAFAFEVPDEPLATAVIGAEIEGAQTVDLEPCGQPLEPGDLVVVVDDLLPSHLRYA